MSLIFISKKRDRALVFKYNPYHDSKGRFASASGKGGFARYSMDPNIRYKAQYLEDISFKKAIDPATGTITKERRKLYNKMLNEMLSGVQQPKNGKPTADFMGGGGGSGKSYVVRSGAIDIPKGKEAVYINSDDIKLKLPEFRKMAASKDEEISKSAANYVHKESSFIADVLTRAAIEKGVNIVIDGTAKNPAKVKEQVDRAHRNGYTVRTHYVTASVENALASNRKRYENNKNIEERRYVPDQEIIQAHKDVSRNFTKLVPLFDSLELITNDKVHKPTKIAYTDRNKKLVVTDKKQYQEFLDKQNYSSKNK